MANVKQQDIRDLATSRRRRSFPSGELDTVAGGVRKAGGGQQEYLVAKLEDCLITGY